MNNQFQVVYFLFFSDIGNPDLSQIIEIIRPWVNAALVVIFGLLGLFCTIKCVIIGYHIIRSADNPEIRSEYLKSLIWPIIGISIAALIPTIITIILNAVGTPNIKG